ncbi:4'-phosphopantetheinyl transferase family protein [Aquimarina sediminis]|uniref:4'-phosphopantetheinyl transferase family protein n=1 Tax=Aquimarina sediminis TaxID=2070536 RepID=UPI000CA07AED|nr:4'-phosphopantetheinyl transferase superfamily protein [Aquimarina sediminis]
MTQILYSYINKENHDQLVKEVGSVFSIEFQRKILKYRRWQDMQLSLLGRFLLKKGIEERGEEFCENSIKYTQYNKPYFDEQQVRFNISHSGDIVICALTDTNDVGIDIEKQHDIRIEDFKSQMTIGEWKRITSSRDIRTSFFEYWTQKEAVIKAHGMGLSIPLKSFEIINSYTRVNNDSFFLKEIKLDNEYKCHIACANKIGLSLSNPKIVNPFVNI